jgi:hypothetical protein
VGLIEARRWHGASSADPIVRALPSVHSPLVPPRRGIGRADWNAITAFYEGLFAYDSGLIRASVPWSGYYELCGKVWALAHVTQNAFPGWRFLAPGVGSGALASGGTYVSWIDPSSRNVTIVVHKPAGSAAETATFQISGPAATAPSLLVWHSALQQGTRPDLTPYYNARPPVAVTAGAFSVSLAPGDLYTFTTTTTGGRGSVPPPPPSQPWVSKCLGLSHATEWVRHCCRRLVPWRFRRNPLTIMLRCSHSLSPSRRFPRAYADDFDACPQYQEAAYFTDQTGAWECVPSNGTRGMVSRERARAEPAALGVREHTINSRISAPRVAAPRRTGHASDGSHEAHQLPDGRAAAAVDPW